jgi:hypothetical protein
MTLLEEASRRGDELLLGRHELLRASVGSTDASVSLPARIGVVGPTRATRLSESPGTAWPKSRDNY